MSKPGYSKRGYKEAPMPNLSTGSTVRIARELLEMSQNDLSKLTGIPQSAISGIEADRIMLGVERAKVLAIALQVNPAVLLFSRWHYEKEEIKARMKAKRKKAA